jgi:hypothetical protein
MLTREWQLWVANYLTWVAVNAEESSQNSVEYLLDLKTLIWQ